MPPTWDDSLIAGCPGSHWCSLGRHNWECGLSELGCQWPAEAACHECSLVLGRSGWAALSPAAQRCWDVEEGRG